MNATYFIRKQLVNMLYRLEDLKPDGLLAANGILKNKHQGKRCFILGSGHSILTQDLKKLQGEIVMTQNHFVAHTDLALIKPTYHVVIPKFHPADYDQDWIDWLREMEQRLPEDCTFFFGKNTQSMIAAHTQLLHRSHFITSGRHAVCMQHATVDLTKRIMNVPTVITQCISIALYMGFDQIYLSGFDLDQICQLAKGRDQVRFYGHSQITRNEAEKKLEDDGGASGFDFFNYWGIWRQLNLLNQYAVAHHQQIINVTNGGLLNMFARADYDQVLAASK